MTNPLAAPWTFDRDKDGTEVVIRDANGQEIVTSRPSWMPESPDNALAMPDLYWQLRVMFAAPKLLEACKQALAVLESQLEAEDPQACTQMEWEAEPLASLREAIALAE